MEFVKAIKPTKAKTIAPTFMANCIPRVAPTAAASIALVCFSISILKSCSSFDSLAISGIISFAIKIPPGAAIKLAAIKNQSVQANQAQLNILQQQQAEAKRQREANKLILEGALPWDIDDALFEFGFPMGPFAMSDLAGLDIGWNKETSNGETLRDVLCEAGRLGQKSGKGFYLYDENRNKSPDPEVEALIKKFGEERQIQMRDISKEEILQRCLYPMINEGFKILEEGMAIRASDIDIVWTNGYGWPVYEGGPMFYGNLIGYDKVLEWLQKAEKELGPEFKPSPYLERVVAEKINIL